MSSQIQNQTMKKINECFTNNNDNKHTVFSYPFCLKTPLPYANANVLLAEGKCFNNCFIFYFGLLFGVAPPAAAPFGFFLMRILAAVLPSIVCSSKM
jgi:hypothetical protein